MRHILLLNERETLDVIKSAGLDVTSTRLRLWRSRGSIGPIWYKRMTGNKENVYYDYLDLHDWLARFRESMDDTDEY